MNPLFICFYIWTAFGPQPACYRYQPPPPPPTYWQAQMPVAQAPTPATTTIPMWPCHNIQPGLNVCTSTAPVWPTAIGCAWYRPLNGPAVCD